ncbi:MAG: glutamine amidotransferase [Verrucomicrobiia bacterium]|jgi:uncharacterized membrane protein
MKDFFLTPILSWPWLVGIVAALVVVIGWSFFYGLRSKPKILLLWSLRTGALLTLLVVMLQPQQRHDEVSALRTQLAVMVDTSESMTDRPDEKQPTRAERVREFLKSPAMQEARGDFDVRMFVFDTDTKEQPQEAQELKFAGSRTDVLGAVMKVQEHLRGQPVAGVLLLSDGLDTILGDKAGASVPAGVPVYAFELEKAFKPKPRERRVTIANMDYPQRVVVGWDTEIRASIGGSGMSGRTVPVELWRDGRKQRGTTVAFNEEEQMRETAFAISHDKPGLVQYEVRVNDPAADKQAKSFPFLIEVLEPGNRLLYIQNTLGFDFKFLRKAITSDRNLQLNAYVRMGDRMVQFGERGMAASQQTLELTQQMLARYAVLILGDVPPESFTAGQLGTIRNFVDRGGALVLLGGPNGLTSPTLARSPLKDVLPVRIGAGAEYRDERDSGTGGFPVEITDTGLRHPVFGPLFAKVKDFPTLLTVNVAEGPTQLAEVLLQAQVDGKLRPAVAATRFGQGRCVVVLTDTIWRWRLASRGWTGDKSPYDTFWTQLMDWLIPKEKKQQNTNRIELFTERTNYEQSDKPEVRAILSLQSPDAKPPATLPLQVRSPDDKTLEYTLRPATLQTSDGKQVPGYRVDVEPHMAGIYVAKCSTTVGSAKIEGETRFVVTKPATELTGKPINRDLLAKIADATKGRFYTTENWNNWRKDLHYEEQRISRVQILDLWNHPALLSLLMGLLAADWIARKFWSLP